MPKANPQVTNFTAGEISPLTRGRVDTAKYANGADEILNYMVFPQGGAFRRPGTRFVGETLDHTKKTRLIPFEFSNVQPYMLELGHQTLRIWKDDTLVWGNNLRAITNVGSVGGPGTKYLLTTAAAHGYSGGQTVYIDEVTQAGGELLFGFHVIDSVTATTITLVTINPGSAPYNYVSGGVISNGVLVLATPWTESDLNAVQFAQSADVMWFAHPGHQPRKLIRFGEISWEFNAMPLRNGPWVSSRSHEEIYKITATKNNGGAIDLITSEHNIDGESEVEVTDCTLAAANGKWRATSSSRVQFKLEDSTGGVDANHSGLATAKLRLVMKDLAASPVQGKYSDVALFRSSSSLGLVNDATDSGKYIELNLNGVWTLVQIRTSAATDVLDNKTFFGTIVPNQMTETPPSVLLFGRDDPPKSRFSQRFARSSVLASAGSATTDIGLSTGPDYRGVSSIITIQSQYTGVFSSQDVGKYVRLTADGPPGGVPYVFANVNPGDTGDNWAKIYRFLDSANVRATRIAAAAGTFVDYSGLWAPGQTHTMLDREIRCRLEGYGSRPFFESDLGRLIRLKMAGSWVHGKIVVAKRNAVDGYYVEVELFEAPPPDGLDNSIVANYGIIEEWQWGAWGNRPGWPASVCFHEQRLVFAGTPEEPSTIWMSVTGDFENFQTSLADGTVLDDSAITYTIASNEVNPISWLQSGTSMLIGTTGGEWQARAASSVLEPITPSNIAVLPQTSIGSMEGSQAMRVGHGILFLQRNGRKLFDLTYSFELDSWQSVDITTVSEHILRKGGGGLKLAYIRDPNNTVFALTNDGSLAAITYNRDQEVAAWHYHQLGGSGIIESIMSLSNAAGDTESLYLSVRRTINGATKRYIEKLDPFYYPSSITFKDDLFYVDCGITVIQASSTTVAGLGHLEAASVDVLANGASVGPKTVSGGQITLSVAATKIQVGFNYVSRLKYLPLEGGSLFGTAHGKTKRSPTLAGRFFMTNTVRVGPVISDADEYTLDEGRLFSGDITNFYVRTDYGPDQGLYFIQDKPYPCVVLAIWPEQYTNE